MPEKVKLPMARKSLCMYVWSDKTGNTAILLLPRRCSELSEEGTLGGFSVTKTTRIMVQRWQNFISNAEVGREQRLEEFQKVDIESEWEHNLQREPCLEGKKTRVKAAIHSEARPRYS